jgi:hypothetical protein
MTPLAPPPGPTRGKGNVTQAGQGLLSPHATNTVNFGEAENVRGA